MVLRCPSDLDRRWTCDAHAWSKRKPLWTAHTELSDYEPSDEPQSGHHREDNEQHRHHAALFRRSLRIEHSDLLLRPIVSESRSPNRDGVLHTDLRDGNLCPVPDNRHAGGPVLADRDHVVIWFLRGTSRASSPSGQELGGRASSQALKFGADMMITRSEASGTDHWCARLIGRMMLPSGPCTVISMR
jgi:hypothetical protein